MGLDRDRSTVAQCTHTHTHMCSLLLWMEGSQPHYSHPNPISVPLTRLPPRPLPPWPASGAVPAGWGVRRCLRHSTRVGVRTRPTGSCISSGTISDKPFIAVTPDGSHCLFPPGRRGRNSASPPPFLVLRPKIGMCGLSLSFHTSAHCGGGGCYGAGHWIYAAGMACHGAVSWCHGV